jgi:hypothetical protein
MPITITKLIVNQEEQRYVTRLIALVYNNDIQIKITRSGK